jgi:dihydrofolate synthase/folylpolyglutamate synthase
MLTNVGLDHTEILGDTVEKIAADKVGIIKAGNRVVSGVIQPSVIEVLEQQCRRTGAELILLGRDFACKNIMLSTSGSRFDFITSAEEYHGLALSILGWHQVINATVAMAAALMLNETDYHVTETAIRNGLSQTHMPGRMEIVGSRPILLLDGAHSPPKMTALVEAMHNLFPGQQIIGVLAFSQGHDAAATLSMLAPLLNKAILTSFDMIGDYGNRSSQPPESLVDLLVKRFPTVERHIELDPFSAIELAKRMASPDDLVCVTGSIFLVGQVRPMLVG